MTEHDRQERTDDLETTLHSIESLQQTGAFTVYITEEAVSEKPAEEAPLPSPRTPFPAAYPLTPIPPSMTPQVEMARIRAPFRLVNDPEIVNYMERFGLSRLHRHVFFLLDGQRTAIDVVRLTGRPFYEIQHLLADLERLGLIGMEHASIGEAMNGM